MPRVCPSCATEIPLSDIKPEFVCPNCGASLKSNLSLFLTFVIFVGGLPMFAFLDNAPYALVAMLVASALCVIVGLRFLSVRAA